MRWLEQVKPFIEFNWDEAKKQNIADSDFYLADLFVDDHNTPDMADDTPLKNDLFVVFRDSRYEIQNKNLAGFMSVGATSFRITDKKRYEQFWKKYKRPPVKEFQEYILERKDLLVPQDIRERKGAFFTPRVWVELSQKYIADVLGENWQEEYYVWDCAAGTGNLLAGLTNKYNIWASTLDMSDVNAMHDRIKNGANLLHDHVFQFDFLNDDFSKLPQGLQDIIKDENKRKKLVIYINPPYAETMSKGIKHKAGLNKTKVNEKYIKYLSNSANRELFVQFLTRIYDEIPQCKIANFSTLKNLQSSNFSDFRVFYQAKLEKIFLVPAKTFDNVTGSFPIAFFVWDTAKKEEFEQIEADVYNADETFIGTKNIYSYKKDKYIIEWLRKFYDKNGERVAYLRMLGTDMQHNKDIFISNDLSENDFKKKLYTIITAKNVIEMCIYHTVRHVFDATWLNDRDQFLYPNDGWKTDTEFQNDCLAYTLFSNNIQSKYGVNNWIPFTEKEVNARDKFASNFMTDFINGKIKPENKNADLFSGRGVLHTPDNANEKGVFDTPLPRTFSNEAQNVFNAGRELWKYYHAQNGVNVNASLYDIREHFQGRNEKGKMNNKSTDEYYNKLIGTLRENLKTLAAKIAPKVYEYGFLRA